MRQLAEGLGATPSAVIEEVSPKDPFFHPDNADHYFESARNALRQIRLALLSARRTEISSVLDFACGYGRVLRMLRGAFPEASLTACDVDRDAVDFCARTFGASAVYSSARPEEIDLAGQFDLIWSGSFFTHIDDGAWSQFLSLLGSVLTPGGVLVFTSAGRYVVERMRAGEHAGLDERSARGLLDDFESGGFGFREYPNRRGERYGLSRATPSWVCSKVESVPELLLLGYSESRGERIERQDFVACVRTGADNGPVAGQMKTTAPANAAQAT